MSLPQEGERKPFGRSASLQELRQHIQMYPPDDSSSNRGGTEDIRVKQSRNGSALKHFFAKYVLCQGNKNKYQVVEPNLGGETGPLAMPASRTSTNSCLPLRQISSYFNSRNSSEARRGEGDRLRREDSADSADKVTSKSNLRPLKLIGRKNAEEGEDPYQSGVKVASTNGRIGSSGLRPNQPQFFLPHIKNEKNAIVVKKLAGGPNRYSQQPALKAQN